MPLAHRGLNKWPIFCSRHFQMHLVSDNYYILVQMSLKFDPNGPTDKKSTLVHVTAWQPRGDKPLAETICHHWAPWKHTILVHKAHGVSFN